MKQHVLLSSLLFLTLLLAAPTQQTVSASGQQQRNTPTPAPERNASGGLGSVVTTDAPTFYWFESEYMTVLLPTAWPNQETELDEAEGTFSLMVAAGEEIMGSEEQGALVILQAADEAVDASEVLDSFELPSEECSGGERNEAPHTFGGRTYTSVYDTWTNCPSAENSLYTLVVESEEIDAVLFAVFFAPDDMAGVAFDIFRNTIHIVDTPPLDAPVRPSTPPTIVPTPTSTPEAEPEAEPEADTTAENTAVVVADRLNVRNGPGTNYARVSAVARNDVLTVVGRNADCSWINIIAPDGMEGWVAAGRQYVNLETACSDIPTVDVPPTPTPQPATATPAAAAPTATTQPAAAQPTQPPAPDNTATDDLGLDPALGCFLFENQLGSEVTITITRRSDSWNVTFRLPRGESDVRCFDPGDYTYTLDAPPPWDSVNGDLRIVAGERILFPIRGR